MSDELSFLNHADKARIVEALLERPRTQEEVRVDLGLERGTASKWIRDLLDEDVLERDGRRGPLSVRRPAYVANMLVAAVAWKRQVALDRARDYADEADELALRLERLGTAGLGGEEDSRGSAKEGRAAS